MDRKPNAPTTTSRLVENGLFARGVPISNTARKITKKDGGILVILKHELAIEPGTIVLQEFVDPRSNTEVQIEGDKVTKFPTLELYKPITVKLARMEEQRGQQTAISWERVD